MVKVVLYDEIECRVLANGAVETRSLKDKRFAEWGQHDLAPLGLLDGHIGVVRQVLLNLGSVFPADRPFLPHSEPDRPAGVTSPGVL